MAIYEVRQLIDQYAHQTNRGHNISSGGVSIDQDIAADIGQHAMTNVRELYLQKNALDGSGLIFLQKMYNLEVLSLSFNTQSKTVYMYRTNTSQQVIEALVKNKPGLSILMEEGPYF